MRLILERLLARAATDPEFAQMLARSPRRAAEVAEVQLTPAEEKILAASAGHLGPAVDGVRRVVEDRRAFLSAATSAAVGLALLSGCKGSSSPGQVDPVAGSPDRGSPDRSPPVAGSPDMGSPDLEGSGPIGLGLLGPITGIRPREPLGPGLRVKLGKTEVRGGLGTAIAIRMIRRSRDGLLACFRREVTPTPGMMEVTGHVDYVVDAKGRVTRSRAAVSPLPPRKRRRLETCLTKVARRTLFPKSLDGTPSQIRQLLKFVYGL